MTPAFPRRLTLGFPTAVAILTFALGLGGSSSSGLPSVASAVLPLDLARLFPELAPLPLERAPELPVAAPAPPAPPPPAPTVDTEQLLRAADRYLLTLPYGREIRRASREHRLDGLLVASVVEAESSFRPDAVSPKGALGLMQLMPLHLEGIAAPLDPGVNLDLGTSYLARLERRYGGDLSLALAAYHAGPGAVKRWGGLPEDGATRRYVERVLTRYQEHRQSLLQEADVRMVAAAVQRGS